MGKHKNYYCEFCDRSFHDILSTRKKHIKSLQHQKMRKMHYDSFKDSATLLQEESEKTPCRRFFQTGQCDFGDHCKFSHQNLTVLKEQIIVSTKKHNNIDLDNVHSWVERWKKRKHLEPDTKNIDYKLPSSFPPVYQLPPSLQPPSKNNNKYPDVQWG